MKTRILCLIIIKVSLSSCQKSSITITLRNPTPIHLTSKPIEIPIEPVSHLFPILTTESGDTLASQLTSKTLFFVADIPPNSSRTLQLTYAPKAPQYQTLTSIRSGKIRSPQGAVIPITTDTLTQEKLPGKLGYQPYQTDGPSFENDKVGFRHYFDGRNSKDLFGKKVSYMSPETVGVNPKGGVVDNYHTMEDWGRDILSVGNSVGIGGINMMIGDTVSRLGCTAQDTITNIEKSIFSILEEGPVRSKLLFKYINWQPFDRTYQMTEEVSIWPGFYGFQNKIHVDGLAGNETLLVGLVNRDTQMPLKVIEVNNRYTVLLTHDKQTYKKEWWLGLALILPKDVYLGFGNAPEEGPFSKTYYGQLKILENTTITYYAIGCWELSDERFKEQTYFESYVTNLAQQLATEIEIEIKNH